MLGVGFQVVGKRYLTPDTRNLLLCSARVRADEIHQKKRCDEQRHAESGCSESDDASRGEDWFYHLEKNARLEKGSSRADRKFNVGG